MPRDGADPAAEGCHALRVVAATTDQTAAAAVRELARLDLILTRAGVEVGPPMTKSFEPHGYAGTGPLCTPIHVAQAAWGNWAPDALVAHDVPRAQMVFGVAVPGLSWIDTYRVARQAWPDVNDLRLEPLLAQRGLMGAAWECPGFGQLSPAGREVRMAAVLLVAMLSDAAVQDLPMPSCPAAFDLQPVLGPHAMDPRVYRLMRLSQAEVEPLEMPPGPWDDDEAWWAVPASDLRWYAAAARWAGWTRTAAAAELRRREQVQEQFRGHPPRVLLRRPDPRQGRARAER